MKKISRRQFLASSLGVLGVGAVGAVELSRHPTLLYRVGFESSPDHSAPNAHVKTESGEFTSVHTSSSVRWTYSVPNVTPLATVFCLHGRSGDHTRPFSELHLPDIVAELGLPLAIAGVDGGEHSYWHKRADGTDTMSMLLDEFIPLIEARTGTQKRALYGWSMGGYGALLASTTRPQHFSATVALSPALWVKSSDSAPGAFDNAEDFRAHDVFSRRDQLDASSVRVSCGTADPFYKATKTFTSSLPGAEVDLGEGAHDASYWRSVSPTAMEFIARKCKE